VHIKQQAMAVKALMLILLIALPMHHALPYLLFQRCSQWQLRSVCNRYGCLGSCRFDLQHMTQPKHGNPLKSQV
jgi:hypothetical protein